MCESEDLFFSDLLQRFRKRKKLNQTQLAKQIGVSRETVSFWERGEYKPETDTTLYELVRVLGLTEQEQDQLFEAYTVRALTTSFRNPPLERNPYFTGRDPQLTYLHTLLMAGKQVALTQAISGLGGIGKTQLALEYAYRYQKSYHDIFWILADGYDSLMTSYVRLAAILHLPECDEQDQNKVKTVVHHWLSVHKGWLLILDNIEDLSLVHQFVPIDRQGAILLTTRRHVTEPVAQALELELLPENDAILFLLKRIRALAVGMSLEDASNRDIVAARAITQLLGNLPLALDQAGAYILETGCSLADYLTLFKKYQPQLLQRRIGEGIPTDHPESITATFRLNFQQVQQRSKVAGELLRLCAFLASDGIGEEIFVKGASSLGTILQPLSSDGLLLNQAIEALCNFSLIRRDSKEKTFNIHRLVQAVLRDEMNEKEQAMWAIRAIQSVSVAFPEVKPDTWLQCERLLTQAFACASLIEDKHLITPEAGSLLNQAGLYLEARARYGETGPLLERALAICEGQLGAGHPATATSLNNLGMLYLAQGEYMQAEPLLERALAIREQQLEPMHPDTATSLNNLAGLYDSQGKFKKAERLLKRTLAICERQLGPVHSDTVQSFNNLAYLYDRQGKYKKAEPLYQRVLVICEEQLGAEHPDTAISLNNLAGLYDIQGKYEKAELLYQRALAIREQQLGPIHPDTANSLNNLALLYHHQRKYVQAHPLYERALAIREQQLGPTHPDIATILNNLAMFYEDQGKYKQAEPLFERALAIREQRLEPMHPDTARSLNNLAGFYAKQGKYEQAEPFLQRALSIYQQTLGRKHPTTWIIQINYKAVLLMGKQARPPQKRHWWHWLLPPL